MELPYHVSFDASSSTTPLPEAGMSSVKQSEISAGILPLPTYNLPDPLKKSHSRKQPSGHIPRPRNAFILFRCDFVRQGKVPAKVEHDHRNISRIAGRIWREMSEKDRRPWVMMADREKDQYRKRYPHFRYASRGASTSDAASNAAQEQIVPGGASLSLVSKTSGMPKEFKHRRSRKQEGAEVRDEISSLPAADTADASLLQEYLRRASSCPPTGAVPVAPPPEYLGLTTLETKDDLARRPSRVVMYHALPVEGSASLSKSVSRPSLSFPWARGLSLNPPMSLGAYTVGPSFDSTPWAASSNDSLGPWTNIADPEHTHDLDFQKFTPSIFALNRPTLLDRAPYDGYLVQFDNPFAQFTDRTSSRSEDDCTSTEVSLSTPPRPTASSEHYLRPPLSPTSTSTPATSSWLQYVYGHLSDPEYGVLPLSESDQQFARDLQDHISLDAYNVKTPSKATRRSADETVSIFTRTLPSDL